MAYFAFEADAYAYRMILINSRMNMPGLLERYAKKDREEDRKRSDREWVVGTEASNGAFFMNEDYKPVRNVDEARGFLQKSDAENYQKYFKKPNTFVKRRKDCR